MTSFPCPFLGAQVELTVEREQHVQERHPDLLPEHRDKIGGTLASPDQVRRSARFGNARMFSRRYEDLRSGKHVVVVVVTDAGTTNRHWIVTAYLARTLTEGVAEWTRA